jgi:hypothetical protein
MPEKTSKKIDAPLEFFPPFCVNPIRERTKWKLNLAQSDFSRLPITIQNLPNGEWRTFIFGAICTFRMEDAFGHGNAWNAVDEHRWEEINNVSGVSALVEFNAFGGDGFTYREIDSGTRCDARLDGKDYPCAGPTLPAGFTVALTNAAGGLEITMKRDSTIYRKETFKVAPDRKSMTSTSFTPDGEKAFTAVYDRF